MFSKPPFSWFFTEIPVFQLLYGWLGGVTSMTRVLKMRLYCAWLASLVPSKQGAYLLPLCSTTQVQKWTKSWVSCSLWAAMIQTGCRVSRCSLRTLEMWHFQLQLHFSKKYVKCVKQATSNSESPWKVLSSCIILFKHDMRPSFLKLPDFQAKNFTPQTCVICDIVHWRLNSVNALNMSNMGIFWL